MSIANLTLADIRNEVKRRLNETSADGLWTTTELNSRINRSYLRVGMDTEYDTKTQTINITKDVAWYPLPSDTLLPLFLYGPVLWQQERLYPSSMIALDKLDQRWEMDGNSISSRFIPFSYDRFILWPPPNATTTISLFYIPVTTDLTSDGATTVLPLQAQKLISIYATYLALRKADFDRAIPFLQEYKQRLETVNMEVRNTSSYHPTLVAPAGTFELGHGSPMFHIR